MKLLLFIVSLAISLYLLLRIVMILVNDLDRLTQYGFGYLAGNGILLLIFAGLAYFLRPKKKRS